MPVTFTAGANATPPNATQVETADDPGVGLRQVVAAHVAKGSKTFSDPAPTTSAASVLAANPARIAALFYNNGAVTIYLGSTSGVTSSNGMPLLPGADLADNSSSDAWWAITGSGTGDLRIIEVE